MFDWFISQKIGLYYKNNNTCKENILALCNNNNKNNKSIMMMIMIGNTYMFFFISKKQTNRITELRNYQHWKQWLLLWSSVFWFPWIPWDFLFFGLVVILVICLYDTREKNMYGINDDDDDDNFAKWRKSL